MVDELICAVLLTEDGMGFIVRLYDKCVLAPVGDTRCLAVGVNRQTASKCTYFRL